MYPLFLQSGPDTELCRKRPSRRLMSDFGSWFLLKGQMNVGTGLGPKGYGRFRFCAVNKRTLVSHRYAYERSVGPIPSGMFVCHQCDNPSCCNPAHLWVGSPAQNSMDCKTKKRHSVGEKNHMTNLSEAQVNELRRRYGSESVSSLSARYGISKSSVYRIAKRQTWAHI